MNDKNSQQRNDVIVGRNCVKEALDSGRAIDYILVGRGEKSGSINPIIAKAKQMGITVKEGDSKKLDFLSGKQSHQGIVAVAAVKEYALVEDIFALAQSRSEPPFIIVLDEIEDPHNLGAIIRTAECVGAHGVIIPKRRSAGLSYITGKTSAGAVEYLPVARVTNLASTIDQLKEKGVWVYGADMDGEEWCSADLTGACALVVGNEGKGLSRLVREKCDVILSLPLKGKIGSLNASVAAGVLMYEVVRQTRNK